MYIYTHIYIYIITIITGFLNKLITGGTTSDTTGFSPISKHFMGRNDEYGWDITSYVHMVPHRELNLVHT